MLKEFNEKLEDLHVNCNNLPECCNSSPECQQMSEYSMHSMYTTEMREYAD